MQRFAHLPVAVSDVAPAIASPQARTGDSDRGTHSAQQGEPPRGRTGRKRHKMFIDTRLSAYRGGMT
eukprot:3903608-Amphidinium_carterae.1